MADPDFSIYGGFTTPALPNNSNKNFTFASRGIIQKYDMKSGTYTVQIGNNCSRTAIPISNILSGLLGIKFNSILESGTPVLLLTDANNTNAAYIIGTLATGNINDEFYTNSYVGPTNKSSVMEELFDADAANNTGQAAFLDGSKASDLAPGEVNFQLGSGAALTLLHTLATLKASDLAKIECFVQDDMVRILNKTYEHLNSLGSVNIYNENGNLNAVWKGTNKEYETFDAESESALGLGSLANGLISGIAEDPSEDFNDDGKWRFVQYIGRLGNFIHTFIQDPKKLLDPNEPVCGTGRFGFHVNEDGSVLCQSISDIALEKVVNIPVPVEKKRWEESGKDNKFDPKYMRNWTSLGNEPLWAMSYKLRDYAKWFADGYSNAGFLGNEERFKAGDPDGMEEPDTFAKDKERQSVDGAFEKDFKETREAFATIRIFKDGSIVLMDAYGSCVHLAGGNMQLSAANNLSINCANALNIMAKDIAITGTDSVTVSATNGTLDLASKCLSRLTSTEGFTVVESTMSDISKVAESKDPRVKSVLDSAYVDNSKDAKEGEVKKVASVIINAKDGTCGNIAINAKNTLYTFAKNIFNTAKCYFINPIRAFIIKNYATYFGGGVYFDSPVRTRYDVVASNGFKTATQINIETQLPSPANAKKSAVSFDSELKGKMETKIDNIKKDIKKISELDAKTIETPTMEMIVPSFTYKTYTPDTEFGYTQTLTDQYFGSNKETLAKAANVESQDFSNADSVFNISSNSNVGLPYPGRGASMKCYEPQAKWRNSDSEKTSGKEYTNTAMSTKPFSTYIKKTEE